LAALGHVGRFGMMVVELVRALPEWRAWLPRAVEQCQQVGYGSLFIVMLTSAFAGAVAAFQAGYQFTGNIPLYVVGAIVSESIILELGPVMTGLLLAGRIGARYAAELGTMRVTEQVDALESLGRNPASHLLLPRVLAGLIMVPALVVAADATGLLAGWLAAKASIHITNSDFVYGTQRFFRSFDLWYSVIKAEAFGAVWHGSIARKYSDKQWVFDLSADHLDAAEMDTGIITDHNAGNDNEYTWWRTEKAHDLFLIKGRHTPLLRGMSMEIRHRSPMRVIA
jgi:phospholipid/cholesterol/gamma-HCH transport system permease protein